MTTNISKRGRTFTGIVTSDKMHSTVTVEWTRRHYIPKYERYSKRKTKIKAHNPEEIDAREGDKVTVMETRPISKTKHFIVIRKHDEEAPEEEPKTEKKTVKKAVKKTVKKAATKKATTKKAAKKEAKEQSE